MYQPYGQTNNKGNFSHKAATLSTDLHCYFECEQTFKKDFELHLHLKLKHRKEDPSELRKAYQAAEEEIALTRRSASTFQCALCPKILHEDEPFRKHIIKNHNWKWEDYKEQYGRCETESAPFECKICGRVVKYSRNTVHGHLTSVHNITWPQYLDRIRKMRKGERPEELPQIESFDCRICNVTVKFILKHLERVHKITEAEYFELYPDQTPMKSRWYKGMASKWTPDDEIEKQQMTMNNPLNTYPMQQKPFQFPDEPLPHSFANNIMYPEKHPMREVVEPPNEFQRNMEQNYENSNPKSLLKPPKSDIQNTKNKSCSSCNTSFSSRKGFIEHCTTAHNMKFKTASGTTITAQTISQKTFQTQEEQEKFKTEPTNQESLNNDQLFKQQSQEREFNPIQNQIGMENQG